LLAFGAGADVLVGNDGLMGEGCDQLDLLVAERSDLEPSNNEHADDRGFPKHWYREEGPGHLHAPFACGPSVLRVRQDIVDVHGPAFEDGPASRGTPIQTYRIPLRQLDVLGGLSVED